MYIPIILGTAREGRESEKVAKFLLKEVGEKLETEILDVRDFLICSTGSVDKESESFISFKEKIEKADALIIVSPEYNHGYPGELKIMLDMLYKEYFGKPVGICGVSSGIFGGARMVEQLRQVCIALHMLPIGEALYFGNVQDLFDEKGQIKDESYKERVKKFLQELTSIR